MIDAASTKKIIPFVVLAMIGVASFFAVGYHHPDEHFQILEFAALKLQKTTEAALPWEYHNQMRPALMPAIVVIIHKLVAATVGESPIITVFILRYLSGVLCFAGLFLLYEKFKDSFLNNTSKRQFLWVLFFSWFLYYCGIRFSSENWASIFFVFGFAAYFSKKPNVWISMLLCGICLGLCGIFRVQCCLMVACFLLWALVIDKCLWKHVAIILLGIAIAFLIGILVDRWFYGRWLITAYAYFFQNIVLDKAAKGFGSQSFLFYLQETLASGVPPISLFIIAFVPFFFFKNPKHPLTWSLLPFVLAHFLISHKELRFLFPIVPFLPFIIFSTLSSLPFMQTKFGKAFVGFCWKLNLVVLVVVLFKPLNIHELFFSYYWKEYPQQSTLYILNEEDNPYRIVGLEANFFKPKGLSVMKISNIADIKKDTTSTTKLFVTQKRTQYAAFFGKQSLVYSTFPNWLLVYNINNWLDRTDCYYLYRVLDL